MAKVKYLISASHIGQTASEGTLTFYGDYCFDPNYLITASVGLETYPPSLLEAGLLFEIEDSVQFLYVHTTNVDCFENCTDLYKIPLSGYLIPAASPSPTPSNTPSATPTPTPSISATPYPSPSSSQIIYNYYWLEGCQNSYFNGKDVVVRTLDTYQLGGGGTTTTVVSIYGGAFYAKGTASKTEYDTNAGDLSSYDATFAVTYLGC